MGRKKKPQTLEELYEAKAEAEDEWKKAKQREKILKHQISKLTRNARTHRLCTRAAMLESLLPTPELLTDDKGVNRIGKCKIEIRCRSHKCNRLFMNYYVTGENIELNLQGFELKCEKCKRVLRFKKYTEHMLIENAQDGVYRI